VRWIGREPWTGGHDLAVQAPATAMEEPFVRRSVAGRVGLLFVR